MMAILKSALLSASAMALVMPTSAIAQVAEAPAVEDGAAVSDADIVVTARRRDESIQDVPAVINAVTSEDIAKLNFRQFQEIQTVVPGLNLATVANGTGGGAQLRGVNFDINASGNNPTVEFYQNDAPITAGVVLQQIYDIGQIEVLRGPQGTLRGRASPSGSITVTTRKPDLYRAGGYVNATGNDIGTINLNGALGVPLIEGIAAIRVAGVIDENDFDRVRTISGRRDPFSRTKSGRITVVVDPIEALHLEGSYQRLERNLRGYDFVESFDVVNSAAAASPVLIRAKDRLSNQEAERRVRQRYDIFNGRAQLSLLGQKLVYQFQHYDQKIDSFTSNDFAETRANFDFGQTTISRPSSESHEVRLQNEERVIGLFDYVVGYFHNKNDVPTQLVQQTPVFLPAALGGRLATTAITNIARTGESVERSLFGNITAHLGEATEVSGGLRHIRYESTAGLQIGTAAVIPDPAMDLKKTIYTASVQHSFSAGLMVYASTGSSFRPGVAAVGDFSVAQSALERSFINLPPETSTSYEIGVKTTFLNRRARFNVSGFHQNFKNYPFRTPGAGIYYLNTTSSTAGNLLSVAQFNFVGAVPVEVNGVEAELGFDISRDFKINAVAAYALGKIKDGTIPCNDLNGDSVPDTITVAPSVAQLQAAYGADNLGSCNVTQRSSFQSPFSASATAEYGRPISGNVDGYLRGLLSYSGNSQGDPTSPFDNVGSFALANIYLGIRDPKGAWEVNLFAKNVFDEVKVLSRTNPLTTTVQVLQPPTFRTAAAQVATNNYTGITTTPPREFGLNVRFAFGSR